MIDQRISFFTIVARNYLAYAYVLGKSVKQYHPECNFFICLIDDINHEYEQEIINKDFLPVYPENLDIKNYKHFVFKYNIVEVCTGVKPFVIKYLLRNSPKVIYLDPDILCFRRLNEAIDFLDDYAIILTPHSLSPLNDDYFPNDKVFLSFGAYNLGFIGVAQGLIADQFLNWWSHHLYKKCLNQPQINLFVDQKWMDITCCYFDKVLILKDLTYNMAYWNLHERTLVKKNQLYYVAEADKPLAFFHFSGFPINDLNKISKNLPSTFLSPEKNKKTYNLEIRLDLVEVFQNYKQLLLDAGHHNYCSINYGYGNYSNGDKISDLERYLFLKSLKWQQQTQDPFLAEPGSFWEFCKKIGLKSSHESKSIQAVEIQKKYNFIIKLIYLCLKIMIKLMGVDLYINFVKYMSIQLLLINHDFLLNSTNEQQKK